MKALEEELKENSPYSETELGESRKQFEMATLS